MVVSLTQPGAAKEVRQLGVPVKLSRTPGRPAGTGARAGRAHARGAGGRRVLGRGDRGAGGVRRRGGPGRGHRGELPGLSSRRQRLCSRMRELAEASGVSAGTIKHYLREGLLPEPVKTSRNMSWYPPEFVERIRLIKQLQEERFMPLKAIKTVLDEDPERAHALVELEDRILERARSRRGRAGLARRGGPALRGAARGAGPAGGAGDPEPQLARLRRRWTSRSSRPSRASAPAATTRRSASPSTTRCATSRRSSRWPGRRWS